MENLWKKSGSGKQAEKSYIRRPNWVYGFSLVDSGYWKRNSGHIKNDLNQLCNQKILNVKFATSE